MMNLPVNTVWAITQKRKDDNFTINWLWPGADFWQEWKVISEELLQRHWSFLGHKPGISKFNYLKKSKSTQQPWPVRHKGSIARDGTCWSLFKVCCLPAEMLGEHILSDKLDAIIQSMFGGERLRVSSQTAKFGGVGPFFNWMSTAVWNIVRMIWTLTLDGFYPKTVNTDGHTLWHHLIVSEEPF